jgi:hypothetical protein
MLKISTFAFAAATMGACLSVSAWGLPVASLDSGAASDVIRVAQCGPTQHRGPRGNCISNAPTASGCPDGKPRAFGRCFRRHVRD